ncbi:transcriptional regulator [Kutzneria viridogrisea]|uniref:Winged helix DNA-binding domain-containing protein n=2 Tax=Kutzneria TaxID=43356 RepID=W5WDB6_9PSEU|nr:transcriptional regulator [Kutzneria albida]AHH99138.1 hypothetical protein KALB_5777 [Kutzneria albida DSM 43870]MBA8923309.1 DNA-binding MarR family transcriptional regulator [Kutzneria viridogrisea]
MNDTHPRFALDDTIHAPVRLSIMAALAAVDRADFTFLRDSIEVSDSLLSKHMTHLDNAGYVTTTKGYHHKRPRTWFALTPAGREAFTRYREVLRQLVDRPPIPTPDRDPEA